MIGRLRRVPAGVLATAGVIGLVVVAGTAAVAFALYPMETAIAVLSLGLGLLWWSLYQFAKALRG